MQCGEIPCMVGTSVIDLEGMACVVVSLRDLAMVASLGRTSAETDAEASRIRAAIRRAGVVRACTALGEPIGLLFAPPGLAAGQVMLCVSKDDAEEVGL